MVTRRRPFRQMGNDLCREAVSAIPNSRRYKENGHNLDLTPIEVDPVGRCLVVMAWPADEQIFMKDMKRSKLIRNSALEVRKCLGQLFPAGFKVYNLCSESKSFQQADGVDVVQFGWLDHEPPPFALFIRLIESMHSYLEMNKENGIAIHCKAGKGRTGTAASAFLLRCNHKDTSVEALDEFGLKRFGAGRGVTIPSQLRYVKYYEQYIKNGMKYEERSVRLTKIQILFKNPLKDSKKDEYHKDTYRLLIEQYNHNKDDGEKRLIPVFDWAKLKAQPDGDDALTINMEQFDHVFKGDVKFKLVKRDDVKIKLVKKDATIYSTEKVVAVFWANTAFAGPWCPLGLSRFVIGSDEFDMKNDVKKVEQVRFHLADVAAPAKQ